MDVREQFTKADVGGNPVVNDTGTLALHMQTIRTQ